MRLVRFVLALLALACATAAQANVGFDGLERSLRLNPLQKERFDVAVQATHKAMLAIGLGALQAKSRLAQELLKDRPDPDALLKAQDELVELSRPYLRNSRDEWIRFYATLDDEQLRVARAFVDEKLRLIERAGAELGRYLSERLQKP